jgi:N-acetylglutamate synthase-like GNAT family acetyltransferase
LATLFALTRAVSFFERLGFARCDRESFPEKIWRDCRLCRVRDRCDEQAVAIRL